MDLVLSAESIEKAFSSDTLFQGLSLGIFTGDRIGLIGKNGAGKTTLLKILSGNIESDAGKVSKKQGTHISYVPQSSSFPSNQSAIEFIRSQHPDRSVEEFQLARTIAKFSDDSFQLDQKISQMSGGQKKRLSIISELIKDPSIVFFDEPTNHLDMQCIDALADEINA